MNQSLHPNHHSPEPGFALRQTLYKGWAALAKPVYRVLPIASPQVISGNQALAEGIAELSKQGIKRPVVITDTAFVGLPVFQRLLDAMNEAKLDYSVFSDIVPDPDFSIIERGIEHCRNHDFDGVIAIGGGSSIDATKVINPCARHDIDPRRVPGMLKLRKRGHYFMAIPTTAGTGSEATAAAVITDELTHQKKVVISLTVVPELAVLDPSLMMGLPPGITAATGMDALTHAMESYLSRYATPKTDALNLESMARIFDHLPRAFHDGANDEEARRQMAIASHNAGVAFTRTSVGWVHAIAHQLGALYGVPHGLANAMILPHVLGFYLPFAQPRMAQMARHIGLQGASDAGLALALVDAVHNLCHQLEIQPLLSMVKEEDIGLITRNVIDEVYRSPYPVPGYFRSYGELEAFIRGMMVPR